MPAAPSLRPLAVPVAGVLIAVSGLVSGVDLLDGGGGVVPAALSMWALALGAGLLAVVPAAGSIVGGSVVGRTALALTGIGPLGYAVVTAPAPWSVAIGTTLILLVTVATVAAAISVVRAGVLRGAGRWALVLVAADALLVGTMSTLPLGDLPLTWLAWHLELVRPAGLLSWGAALVLHGRASAIRRLSGAVEQAWRRNTEVGAPR